MHTLAETPTCFSIREKGKLTVGSKGKRNIGAVVVHNEGETFDKAWRTAFVLSK